MSDFVSQLFSPANLSLSAAAFQLLTGLFINSIVVWLIVHFFYYPKGRRRDYYFTFVLLSVSVFMLIALLLRDAHASARSERVRLCARPAVRFYKAGKPETGRYGPAAEPLSKIGTYRIPYARNGKTEEDSQGKANLPENNEGTEMVPYLRFS